MGAGRPKGSTGVNKSGVIREYITSHPDATTNEIVEALGQRGVDVSQALVAGVRSRVNGGPGNKTRSKVSKGEVTIKELNSVHSIVEHFEDVNDAKSMIQMICGLIEDIGSIERLNETLKAYEDWKPTSEVSVEESSLSSESSESSESESESSDDEDDSYDDDDEDEEEDE